LPHFDIEIGERGKIDPKKEFQTNDPYSKRDWKNQEPFEIFSFSFHLGESVSKTVNAGRYGFFGATNSAKSLGGNFSKSTKYVW
jgi:hypothetical protein